MQTQLNLSSRLIGCHWVLSLWSISCKKRILFCDLQCSENYLAQFPFSQKNRPKRNYKGNVIAFLLLAAGGVCDVTALKLRFSKANFLQQAVGAQISSTINLPESDYVLNDEKNRRNFIKQNDLLCDIIYLFYYIIRVRIEMKWVFLV